MSLRRSLYILLVMTVAGFSALTGALAAGAVVYRSLQQGSANLPGPIREILPANNAAPGQENSPASEAGLQPGDIITRIGDVTLDETHSYVNALFEYKPGDQITLEIVHGNETMQVNVTLGEAQTG